MGKNTFCLLAGALLIAGGLDAAPAKSLATDVVIYGGTPAGIAAAVEVIRHGAKTIVVEPTSEIGGMVTGGIAVTDTSTPDLVGGIAREFFEEVHAETVKIPERDDSPVLNFRGKAMPWRAHVRWDLEPKTARVVFERWVKKPGLTVITGQRVTRVQKSGEAITAIELENETKISGKVFIDASYEGDLMSRAGVSHTYGREAAAEYGEKLGGVRVPHFLKNYSPETYQVPGPEYMHHGQFGADIPARDEKGKLLWGVEPATSEAVGAADKRVQAYCFRLIATQRKDILVPWPNPPHYQAARYELLLRYVKAHPGISFARLVHLGAIPHGKFDLNASGPFSIDYVGGNPNYPDAGYRDRDRMYQDHIDYEMGFLWFLAHDPRVPQELRDEVNSWGLCRDEWADTKYWPVQLYIREGRRLKGELVMTENDVLHDQTKPDSIGLGSFVLDSHWVRRFVNESGFARVEGHLDESIDLHTHPYEIPYRSVVPKEGSCSNLLVPVCMSASHVAICTIRMEPVYMELGQAAGLAAAEAIQSSRSVQDIDLNKLTGTLKQEGAILHKADAKTLPRN